MRRILILVMAVVWLVGCPNAYTAAWQTLDGIQKAKALTAKQLARVATVKHGDCLKVHGAKTPAYAECMKSTREMLKQWRTNVRPAVNSAVGITATAVNIAERAKKDPKLNWLQLVKPAVCALIRAAKTWGHYYGDKGKTVLAILTGLQGVTCQ